MERIIDNDGSIPLLIVSREIRIIRLARFARHLCTVSFEKQHVRVLFPFANIRTFLSARKGIGKKGLRREKGIRKIYTSDASTMERNFCDEKNSTSFVILNNKLVIKLSIVSIILDNRGERERDLKDSR